MKRTDFTFELPPELIAQTPLPQRDASRLMVLDRRTGEVRHRHFTDLTEYLRPGDCLVMNDSRVLPARLLGVRPTGGAAELLLLRELGEDCWECLAKPARKLGAGQRVIFGDGALTATVREVLEDGGRIVKFSYDGIFLEILDRLGRMPLPPYIKKELQDQERYQTVYSRETGSAAAPTAGLHFTNELLETIREMGVSEAFVTLHVGLGTFRPVKEDNIEDHDMHSEFCQISREAADKVNAAKERGSRVIAVGTTSCRTLEAFSDSSGRLEPASGWTDIFIYPGYSFKCVDALVTNFHLPESTLLMLISALAGRDRVLAAYREAVQERYRFFSFGDSSFFM